MEPRVKWNKIVLAAKKFYFIWDVTSEMKWNYFSKLF